MASLGNDLSKSFLTPDKGLAVVQISTSYSSFAFPEISHSTALVVHSHLEFFRFTSGVRSQPIFQDEVTWRSH
jgi:hypothetical protein